MKTQNYNLFIVDDNPQVVSGLHSYLTKRFGEKLNISVFSSGITALNDLKSDTDIVILDYVQQGGKDNEVLNSIKVKNPKTELIRLSGNEEIGSAIDAYENNESRSANNQLNIWTRGKPMIRRFISYPVRILVQEFGINKYIAMFLLTFTIMGVGVFFALRYIN